MGSRRLVVGCDVTYQTAVATSAIFQVQPAESPAITRRSQVWSSTPRMTLRTYVDLYGNPCTRVVLPGGWSTFRYEGGT